MTVILGTEVASAVQTSAVPVPAALDMVIPPPLGWDMTRFPLKLSLYDTTSLSRTYGYCNLNPEMLFATYSTALSAPGATYFVSTTGSDSNTGLTQATAFLTISKAVTSANTGGLPTRINVAAGIYPRSGAPGGTTGVTPTVDIAFVATGGRVVTGTFDLFAAPTADATNTNTYSYTTGNTDRVVDLTQTNQYGNYVELVNVSTAAICNNTQGSWSQPGDGKLYIRRTDGAAVTNANTRVYRGASYGFYFQNQVNVYIGDGGVASFPAAGFDVEGASQNGSLAGLMIQPTTQTNTSYNLIVVKASSFKYGGGLANPTAKNVAVESFNGLVALFNCRADAAQTDGFNHHNSLNAALPLILTVNCSAQDNGRGANNSNNGWTSHENCIGIDLAGYYRDNRGGTVRSINTARAYLAGTFSSNDRGDVAQGGALPPDAFSVGNSATYYCERTRADVTAGSNYMTESTTASIFLKNVMQPPSGSSGGPGTFTITS